MTKLSLALFDQLRDLHHLDDRERLLLECAGRLHDIGWSKGRNGHHKESMRMILADDDLGLTPRERLIVANVARYHRKALPSERHVKYRNLSDDDKALVSMLGGMLRLADGMDYQHLCRTHSVLAKVATGRLTVTCQMAGDASPEKRIARAKSDLLSAATGRTVVLRWTKIQRFRETCCAAAAILTQS